VAYRVCTSQFKKCLEGLKKENTGVQESDESTIYCRERTELSLMEIKMASYIFWRIINTSSLLLILGISYYDYIS